MSSNKAKVLCQSENIVQITEAFTAPSVDKISLLSLKLNAKIPSKDEVIFGENRIMFKKYD